MWLPALIGALGGIAGGAISYQGNKETNQMNAQLTREQNEQNERLMREQWQREDTAYSRAAADLEKAGLSKTLAAGHPASAGSVVPMQKAEYSNPTQKAVDTAYRLMSMVQDFQRRANENALLASQIHNVNATTAGHVVDNAIKNFTLTEQLPIDRDIKQSIYDKNTAELQGILYNLENFGNSKGPGNAVRAVWDVYNLLTGGYKDNGVRQVMSDIGKGRSNALGNIFRSVVKNLNL